MLGVARVDAGAACATASKSCTCLCMVWQLCRPAITHQESSGVGIRNSHRHEGDLKHLGVWRQVQFSVAGLRVGCATLVQQVQLASARVVHHLQSSYSAHHKQQKEATQPLWTRSANKIRFRATLLMTHHYYCASWNQWTTGVYCCGFIEGCTLKKWKQASCQLTLKVP